MKGATAWIDGAVRLLVCGLAALTVTGESRAADGIWLRTSADNWSDTANWANGSVAAGAGSVASFTNAAGVTINQNMAGLTLGGLLFANANHTVTNGAIILDRDANRINFVTDGKHRMMCFRRVL